MMPKQNMINLVFDGDGNIKVKCEAESIPTQIVEEVINSAVKAYECMIDDKINKDEKVKYLKRWNLVLSIALTILTILNLVR